MDDETDDLSEILDSGPASLTPANLLARDDLPAGARQWLEYVTILQRDASKGERK